MPACKKQHRNLAGLRNQGSNQSSPAPSAPPSPSPEGAEPLDQTLDILPSNDSDDEHEGRRTMFDRLRNDWEAEEAADTDSDIDSELASDEDFNSIKMRKSWKNQTKLDNFITSSSRTSSTHPSSSCMSSHMPSPQCTPPPGDTMGMEIEIFPENSPQPIIPHRQHASASPDQLSNSPSDHLESPGITLLSSGAITPIDLADNVKILEAEKEVMAEVESMNMNTEQLEAWEDELDENIQGPNGTMRPWSELREKIRNDIKKGQKTLSLSHLNSLMLVFNFATLWTKGHGRISASQQVAAGWHKDQGVRAKCRPVCPIENQECCIAHWLSHQDDFKNQPSMIEELIKRRGHEYWGWVKYRFREEDKPKFEDAKLVAVKYLDACPAEVIRHFINRTWRWMMLTAQA
ncbi:hypothetical protein C8J57DRAFT_1250758 [Mycena rebaudengoi]|nr:hypothetical protein C8J57DRAFT_1250758 [Mycena rebaudengoi]